jgi:hypothetical protein
MGCAASLAFSLGSTHNVLGRLRPNGGVYELHFNFQF